VPQIQLGQDADGAFGPYNGTQGVTGVVTQTTAITGLLPGTQYRDYSQQQDSVGGDSSVIGSAIFTTDALLLSSPSSANTGQTTYTGGVTNNASQGVLDHVVTQFITTPSGPNIIAGLDHLGNPADALGQDPVNSVLTNVNGVGLVNGTTYYIHYVWSALGSVSDPVTSPAFTTVVQVQPTITPGGPYIADILVATSMAEILNVGTDSNPAILREVVSGGTGTFTPDNAITSTFTADAESRIVIRLTVTPNDGDPVIDITTFTTTNYVPSDTETGIINNIVRNISTNIVRGVT